MSGWGFAGCPKCREPLVSTMEFRGYEFICVPCDTKYEFLRPISLGEATPEIEARHAELRDQYRAARAAREQAAEVTS